MNCSGMLPLKESDAFHRNRNLPEVFLDFDENVLTGVQWWNQEAFCEQNLALIKLKQFKTKKSRPTGVRRHSALMKSDGRQSLRGWVKIGMMAGFGWWGKRKSWNWSKEEDEMSDRGRWWRRTKWRNYKFVRTHVNGIGNNNWKKLEFVAEEHITSLKLCRNILHIQNVHGVCQRNVHEHLPWLQRS